MVAWIIDQLIHLLLEVLVVTLEVVKLVYMVHLLVLVAFELVVILICVPLVFKFLRVVGGCK